MPGLPRGRGRHRLPAPRLAGASPPPCPAADGGWPPAGQARPCVQLVYVNSFGSHRCGSVIRYGRGCGQAGESRGGPPPSQRSPARRASRQRAAPEPGGRASSASAAAGGGAQAEGSCGGVKPVSRRHGDLREAEADTFDFPFPSRNVDKVIKRKKQKSKVWFKVCKVISKMLEENEEFRSRLLTCSQFNGEDFHMKGNSSSKIFFMRIKECNSGSKQKFVYPHKCPLQCTVDIVGVVEEIPEYAATTYSTIILRSPSSAGNSKKIKEDSIQKEIQKFFI